MSADDNFLSRWSRRKTASKAGPTGPLADAVPAKAGIQPTQPTHEPPPPEAPLPPIESLTPDSDFTAFMRPDVDPAVKREALKVLVRDPRFNVMDGLDVYIDDYSKPDPIPEEWLGQLNMMKRLGSFVEEPEKPVVEAASALQKPMTEQPLGDVTGVDSSDTENDKASNDSVTESGTAGGKLPRNEA